MTLEQQQYPIGKFKAQESYSAEDIQRNISRIEAVPAAIEAVFQSLTPKQLDTPYREGGWTARQVIHHVTDSHTNAFVRLKWTLTEDKPLIKAYNEKAWALTAEVHEDPAISIALLKPLHVKWVTLLRTLTPEQLQRSFIHPETKLENPLARVIALYAWHGEHHLGHLNLIKDKH